MPDRASDPSLKILAWAEAQRRTGDPRPGAGGGAETARRNSSGRQSRSASDAIVRGATRGRGSPVETGSAPFIRPVRRRDQALLEGLLIKRRRNRIDGKASVARTGERRADERQLASRKRKEREPVTIAFPMRPREIETNRQEFRAARAQRIR